MDKPMPNWAFNGMAFMFSLRDVFARPDELLREADIEPGYRVLDYGCGPGSYVPIAAEQVGPEGRIYALDLHPLAVERVQSLARRRQLSNVETIRSDCHTGLPKDSVDVVLLYDILHMLSEPHAVLSELRRVLKPEGRLSVTDPHMKEDDIVDSVTVGALFELATRGAKTYSFAPL